MQHDGALARAVLVHELGAEALRQHEVHLQRSALPVAADGIPQHELELGAVERALARVELDLQTSGCGGLLERGLDLVGLGFKGGNLGKQFAETVDAEFHFNLLWFNQPRRVDGTFIACAFLACQHLIFIDFPQHLSIYGRIVEAIRMTPV